MDVIASLRIEAKPQRVDKWRIDFHSSYERSGFSKSLCVMVPSISSRDVGGAVEHNLLGIYDREEGLKVFVLYVTQ
jgi:hypothetical protein